MALPGPLVVGKDMRTEPPTEPINKHIYPVVLR